MATGVERRMKCTLKLPLIPPRETPACPLPQPRPRTFLLPLPPPPPPPAPPSAPGAAIDKSKHPSAAPLLSHEDNIDPADTIKLCLLGHGSSGKVYKVRHKHTGKIYALKVIQEKNWENQILTTEMCILRRANSRHVIRCHGASLSDKNGDISFVLEYMDGGSLASVLETHGTINEHYLGEVASQVLRGLNYLHSNKIVHRDIKPSNLLINQKQEVKIADFGVSSVLDSSLAPCNSFVGTCAYMSPERFDPDSHGGNYCGYAADIWSLGLTLLECAIGHYPYLGPGQNADWPTLMVGICYGEPPSPPSGTSPLFRDFIMRCLQKDPIKRPRASVLLSHPFVARYENSPCDISGLLRSPSL